MRRIEITAQFRRDYRREKKGQYRNTLDGLLEELLPALAADAALAVRYQDHALGGQWKGFRDCHVKPDLVLIYQKPDNATLRLVRLGSHANLSL